MNTKKCTKCKLEKSLNCFGIVKERQGKPSSACKECHNKSSALWYSRNKEKEQARRRELRKNGIEYQKRKERYHNDLEYRQRQLDHVKNHKQTEEGKRKSRERTKAYRKNPRVRIKQRLSGRINEAIRDNIKSQKTTLLLGCSIDFLIQHLESLFKEGMCWDNYGAYKRGGPMTWHVDHIIPCAAFDLSKPEEQQKCFHWSNLQPLWADENCRKRDLVPDNYKREPPPTTT